MTIMLATLAPFVAMVGMWLVVCVWDALHAPVDPSWSRGDISQLDRRDGVNNPRRVTIGQTTHTEGSGR